MTATVSPQLKQSYLCDTMVGNPVTTETASIAIIRAPHIWHLSKDGHRAWIVTNSDPSVGPDSVCRELRRKRLVDAAMRKHGLKSASKKARALAAAEEEVKCSALLFSMQSQYVLEPPDVCVLCI